jgi:hypothetical protein
MNLNAINQAIAAQLQLVDGIRVYDGYRDKPEPPCVWPFPNPPIDLQQAMGKGACRAPFSIHVLVPFATDTGANQILELLSGGTGAATSVIDALETDPTFGGIVASSVVTSIVNVGETQVADGLRYLGAEIELVVFTDRK